MKRQDGTKRVGVLTMTMTTMMIMMMMMMMMVIIMMMVMIMMMMTMTTTTTTTTMMMGRLCFAMESLAFSQTVQQHRCDLSGLFFIHLGCSGFCVAVASLFDEIA